MRAAQADSAGHTPASLDGDARRAFVCGEALAARSCQPELAPLRQEHQDSQGGREPGTGGHHILAQRNRARSPRRRAQHIAAAAATTTAEGLAPPTTGAGSHIWSGRLESAHHWHANGAIDLVDLSIRDSEAAQAGHTPQTGGVRPGCRPARRGAGARQARPVVGQPTIATASSLLAPTIAHDGDRRCGHGARPAAALFGTGGAPATGGRPFPTKAGLLLPEAVSAMGGGRTDEGFLGAGCAASSSPRPRLLPPLEGRLPSSAGCTSRRASTTPRATRRPPSATPRAARGWRSSQRCDLPTISV